MRLKVLTILIAFLGFVVPTAVSASMPGPSCSCMSGSTSDQGCMAFGCPTGTRRTCTCGSEGTGGACTPVFGGDNPFMGVWSCYCVADATCSSGGGTGNPPQPGCTPVAPTAPTTIRTTSPGTTSSTAPGRQFRANVLRITYSGGSYGEGCPTIQGNDLQIRRQDNSNSWTSYGSLTRVDDLPWGTALKWRIRRTNGNSQDVSASDFFVTGTPPSISNFTVTSLNSCSATPGYVGSAANQANNPLVIQYDVFDPDNNFAGGVNVFRNTRIALSPNANQIRRFDQLEPDLHQPVTKTAAGFRAVLFDFFSTTPRFASTDYSDGSTGTSSTSGTHTNAAGNASLLDINGGGAYSSSVVQVDNQTLRVKFVVRLENTFANSAFYIHATVVSRKIDYNGDLEVVNVTPDPVTGLSSVNGNLRYRNYQFVSGPQYVFDTVAPTVAVGTPQSTGPSTFNVNWTASDSRGLAILRSYCYLTSGVSATIRDIALATNIALGNTVLNYPNADNCLVDAVGRLGNRSYQDLSGSITPGMNFKLHAVDNACNSANATNFTVDNRPWVATGNGNVSSRGGYNSFTIRDTAYNYTSNLSGTQLTPPPYLSTYIAISGNAAFVNNKPSRFSLTATNYTDNKFIPQILGGTVSWREAIHAIVSTQPGFAMIPGTSITIPTGNMSTSLGVAANATVYRYYTGNLTVNSGAVCNVKAVIVVLGTLTMNAPFTSSPLNTNGCVFVSGGNMIINPGTHASAGGSQQYDTLHGLFVTDSTFYSLPAAQNADRPNGSLPADGLYIRGGVIARAFNPRRDLGGTNNPTYPAEIIEYDPFYLATFGNVLASKKFSLRQQ